MCKQKTNMDSEDEQTLSEIKAENTGVEGKKNIEEKNLKQPEKGQRKKASKADEKDKKDWTDNEIFDFIDMLEERVCLWDIFHKDYSKRDLKEIDYSVMAETFDTNIKSIKAKINGLRAQLGREKTKETTTKSGQAADELYESSWIHYNRLGFLLPVMGASKSKETFRKRGSGVELDFEVVNIEADDHDDGEASIPPKSKKRSVAERKLELLAKCTEAITKKKEEPKKEKESKEIKMSTFALYIDEKLRGLDDRKRAFAEKRITDVIFELEFMDEINNNSIYSGSGNVLNLQHGTPGNSTGNVPFFSSPSSHGPYSAMLRN